MLQDRKQCETCPWPLECSPQMKAAKPDGADCPRDAHVWERRVGDGRMAVDGPAALDELAEFDHVDLVLT